MSTWFSLSTIWCWHWTSTSVFVVTVTPSPCSPHCILSLWTCHFSVSCQRNTFCWGPAISVLCSQTPSLLIHLCFSASCRPWTSARNCHTTSFHLEFLSITGALWISQERNMAKDNTAPQRSRGVQPAVFLLQPLPAFWKPPLLILWPMKVFPLLPSLPVCHPGFLGLWLIFPFIFDAFYSCCPWLIELL